MKLEQQLYRIEDLENLSVNVMYSFGSKPLSSLPSRPLREPTPISIRSFPDLSRQFSCLDNYERSEEKRQKEQQELRERQQKFIDSISYVKSEPLHKDFEGSSWSKSFEPTDLVIKPTPLGTLHIHCTGYGLLTGANLDGDPVSNYDAAMLALFPSKDKKKNGFGEW